MSPPQRSFLVVAVGGSAGGLDAFGELLESLPEKPNLALLFAAHLAEDAPSMLPELLSRRSELPVVEAADGMRLEADHGYVIPRRRSLALTGGALHLEPVGDGAPDPSIDRLFYSVAEALGERAVGVVLSGTGSDGTLGLEAIKSAGGVTFASDDASAKYPGMPRSAIASGAVDHVLSVRQIAARVAQIARLGDGRDAVEPPDGDTVTQILARVRDVTGHDFSGYKRGTIQRRIERRQRALGVLGAEELLERMDDEEAEHLFRDLLVGVTSFFRDPAVFEALESEILPASLSRSRPSGHPIRAWVPGCSTGQEAYSIAMTLMDAVGELGAEASVQVFATDIDPVALDVARRGLYPASATSDVPPSKLRRYFTAQGELYQVNEHLRARLIFSEHSVVRDPPFSRLDLVSCRNVLIYLESTLQQRALHMIHYGLEEDGLLVLGSAEGTSAAPERFELVDSEHGIARRRSGRSAPVTFAPPRARQRPPSARDGARGAETPRDLGAKVERALLDGHTPPALVIWRDGEIAYVHGRTASFLELPAGVPSANLLRMLPSESRAEVRAAIHQALRGSGPMILPYVRATGTQRARLTLERLDPEGGDGRLLVLFDPLPEPPAPVAQEARDQRSLELEQEVQTLREALQTTVEDLETTNEELSSSNEELLSMNEELQSSNEELETSKEEVQSVNEELASVNTELQDKVRALTRINDDVTNLLSITRVATLFLDAELRVSRFTPALTDLYRLKITDEGRPIGDLGSSLDYPELADDAARVMQELQPFEREVEGEGDRHFIARVLPYRTVDDRIEGVVLTFVDISERARTRRELSDALDAAQHYREALDASTQIALLDEEGVAIEVNERLAELWGGARAQLEGTLHLLDPKRIEPEVLGATWASLKRGEVWRGQLPFHTARGDARIVDATLVPLRSDREGPARHLALIADITSQVKAERALRRSEERFRTLFEYGPVGVAMVAPGGWIEAANPALCEILGYEEDQLLGTRFAQYAHSADQAFDEALLEELAEGKRDRFQVEKRFRTADGRTIFVHEAVSAIPAPEGVSPHLVAMVQDVTEAREARERLRRRTALIQLGEMSAVMAHEVRNALAGIRSAVEVVGDELPPRSEEWNAVGDVRDRIDQLEATVQELMHFARPRTPERAPVELRELLDDVVASLRAEAPETTIRVHGDPITLRGDERLLRAAFLNLCFNAVQAVENAGGTVEVHIERVDDRVRVKVIDEGPGIPDEVCDKVFEPFFTTRSRGTGLGLPIARRVFEAHGGSVALETHPERGTTVVVQLPISAVK